MLKMGLFQKILSITLVVVISLLLGGWLIVRSLTLAHVENQIAVNHSAELNKLALFTHEWLETGRTLLAFTASLPSIQSMDPDAQTSALIELQRYLPASYLNMVLDRHGVSQARSDGDARVDYSDRRYVQEIISGGARTSYQLAIGRTSKKPALIQAVAIIGGAADVNGLLVSALDLDDLNELIRKAFDQTERYYLVLDPAANIIASSTEAINHLEIGALPSLACRAQTSRISPIRIDPAAGIADQAILLSACQLEGGWHLVFIENAAHAYAEIKSIDTLSLLLLVLVMGVGVLTSWIQARLIISRLDQLGEEVILATQKDSPVALEQGASLDEFGRLQQTVTTALNGQALINRLLQLSYEQTSAEAFVQDALNILNTSVWTTHISTLEMYLSLKEDPDLFYMAALTDSGLQTGERSYETLPKAIRECMASNTLMIPMSPEGSECYIFPIYLDNTSGGCLSLTPINGWLMQDQEARFIITYLDVVASIINHLSASFALQRQEQLTTQLIDNSDLVISVRSLGGEIRLFNRGFEQTYGVRREEHRRLYLDALSEQHQRQLCINDNEVAASASTVSFDEHIVQADGSSSAFQTVKFPISDPADEIVAIGTVSTNISARLQMEERLQDAYLNLENQVMARTQELHQSNGILIQQKSELELLIAKLESAQSQLLQSEKLASIGQLAAGVAHEINNPIGFVNSNLGSLQQQVSNMMRLLERFESHQAKLPETASDEIDRTKLDIDFDFLAQDITALINESLEGIGRVKKIVADLKSFSRVDSGEWDVVDIHDCIESTINVAWNELKYKAELKKEYGPVPEITCHASQINQVVMNILVNAAQAIPDFGQIRISTGVCHAGIWIEIADNGQGMTEATLKRVFEPFFTTKAVGKGTGLGLSVSYNIIKTHAGRLSVASQPGEGTVFRIELPINPQQNTEPG